MAYEDLLKDTSASFEDGNYFVVTVPDLTPGTIYPLEFRWKYKDGTFSEWGCVKTITAASESIPKKPGLTATYFQGIITVAWDGKGFDTNSYSTVIDRVEIYLQNVNIGVYFPAGSIQYNNGVGGTLSIPVEPGTYKIKGRAVSKGSLESTYSDEITVTAKLTAPASVSTLNSAWSGSDFTITFTHDPSAEANKWLSYYLVTLTSGSDTKTFNLLPVTGTSQKFSISLAGNRAAFGVPKTSFSGSVSTVDIYGNIGTPITFGSSSYVNSLSAPIISATEIQQGYSISYTTPTSATYDHIEIEEVESNAGTAPSTGYSVIFSGVANPAPIIRPNQNKRWVRARFADNIGSFSAYSTAIAVTPLSPVTVDNVPPASPSSGTVTAGVDNSAGATVGFNAYLNISWTAVSDSTLRGYRIRFRENGTSGPYSYVDSPGTGTTFRLNGLSIGTTYEVAVASYDEYNNTSSAYTSIGTATATGTPFIGKNVTTVGYFGASATGDTGTFKFGYGVQDSGGTKRGLVFNPNNYWYIDSAQSALFKLGGDTDNYISWDGATFIVQGDLRAKKGNFSGNVEIQSGGSLYSGSLTQAGALSGAGFILNNSGLTFNSSSVTGITTINGTTGLLTTKSANIGGWDVDSSSIKRTSSSGTITLSSTNAQIIASSTSYQAGIATPDTNSASDIVFWAGGARNTSANFYVRADGTVVMGSATITGYATSGQLTTTNNNLATTNSNLATTNSTVATKVGASEVTNHIGGQNVTTITGNRVRTGTIEGNSYSYSGTNNPFSDSGTSIDLTNNIIRSPEFAIVGGSAYFKGALSAATGSFNGSVTASTFSLTAGSDFWNSNGSFQFGGSTGITKSTTGAISIGSNVNISGSLTASQVNTTNLTIDTAGRIYNSGGFEVTSAGKIIATGATITGEINATSGKIAGFNVSAVSDLYADTSVGPRILFQQGSTTIMHFGWQSGSYTSGTYAFIAGQDTTDLGAQFYVNTKTNVFRFAADSSARSYAAEVRSTLRATNLRYITGLINDSSSIRFKENVNYLPESYYSKILNVKPAFYTYKENHPEIDSALWGTHAMGPIAEDLEEAGLGFFVERNLNGEPTALRNEHKLAFLLIPLVKDMKEKIDILESRIIQLEGNNV